MALFSETRDRWPRFQQYLCKYGPLSSEKGSRRPAIKWGRRYPVRFGQGFSCERCHWPSSKFKPVRPRDTCMSDRKWSCDVFKLYTNETSRPRNALDSPSIAEFFKEPFDLHTTIPIFIVIKMVSRFLLPQSSRTTPRPQARTWRPPRRTRNEFSQGSYPRRVSSSE